MCQKQQKTAVKHKTAGCYCTRQLNNDNADKYDDDNTNNTDSNTYLQAMQQCVVCAGVFQASEAFEITDTIEMVRLNVMYSFQTGSSLFISSNKDKLFVVVPLAIFYLAFSEISHEFIFQRTGLNWSIFGKFGYLKC